MKDLFKFSLFRLPERRRGRGLAILLSLLVTQEVMADGIVVVPAKAAGYLYNPDANESNVEEISLHLIKEGGFTNYRIESDPPGFLCDESCPETVQRLPAGKVVLTISGYKPFPLLKIPLRGQWTEGCDDLQNETNKCIMNLNETNARVKLEVDPNVQAGTIMPMPDGSMEVMFIKEDASRGYVLVAAHNHLGSGRTWLAYNPDWTGKLGIGSRIDGKSNSARLINLNSEAARYCANLEGDWYLPASGELMPGLTTKALDKIPGIDKDNFLWTSTENGISGGSDKRVLQAHAINNSNASLATNRDVYNCTVATGNCTNVRRYQILCVTRISI